MQDILDLIVTEHTLLMEQIWEDNEHNDSQLNNAVEEELVTRSSHYKKGGSHLFN